MPAEAQTYSPVAFRPLVEMRLAASGTSLARVCPVDSDAVARRVFAEYGAMFVSTEQVKFPIRCVFIDETDVSAFQNSIQSTTANIGSTSVQLQTAAMEALLAARKKARQNGLDISPRGGATASRRSYESTVRIWNSRFEPALKHWVARKKISAAEADAARTAETHQQVVTVMGWEAEGLYFNTNFSRTIFSSVAAPGTSQHLAMLALDVEQFANANVRKILNDHGWYQTIANDLPHFTFLGYPETELPKRGLRPFRQGGFLFWVPNI